MKKSNILIIVVIVIILPINVIGGYIIGKKLLIPKFYNPEEIMESMPDDEDSGVSKSSEMPGILRDLDSINLNPSNSAGEIFSCQFTLEAKKQAVIDELALRDAQIKDIILTYLSFKSIQELNDVTKRDQYREELIENINSVLTKGKISNLYIIQWILQFS